MQWGNPALMRQILVISGHPLRRHPPALANDREKPIDPALAIARRSPLRGSNGTIMACTPTRRSGRSGWSGRGEGVARLPTHFKC